MDDLKGRQELYNGFGDSMSRAIELVVTPLLFGLFGLLLDHVFGLTPMLTIGFAAFAVVGMSVKLYYAYDQQMRAHEASAPWSRPKTARPR